MHTTRRPVARALAVATLLALVAACHRGREAGADSTGVPAAPMNPEPAQNAYAPALGVDLSTFTTLPSGVLYRDKTVGTGAEAAYNTRVRVHYTGWLPTGRQFDSSRERGERDERGTPFEFVIGAREVIRGWEEGITGMKVGGRRTLVVPAVLGYGRRGSPPDVPPNAVLVFDVELLGVNAPNAPDAP